MPLKTTKSNEAKSNQTKTIWNFALFNHWLINEWSKGNLIEADYKILQTDILWRDEKDFEDSVDISETVRPRKMSR